MYSKYTDKHRIRFAALFWSLENVCWLKKCSRHEIASNLFGKVVDGSGSELKCVYMFVLYVVVLNSSRL